MLEDGEAVGMGTHEELLESCRVYREIYESQYQSPKPEEDNSQTGRQLEQGSGVPEQRSKQGSDVPEQRSKQSSDVTGGGSDD